MKVAFNYIKTKNLKKMIVLIILRMKLQILYLPNKLLAGPGINDVKPDMKISDILDNIQEQGINTKNRELVIDKSAGFSRIAENDEANRYWNGHIGDIFRITDDSSTRYRMVIKAIPKAKDKGKPTPLPNVTANMYVKAYSTLLEMLRDRQGLDDQTKSVVNNYRRSADVIKGLFDDDQLNQLDIVNDPIPNRRGRLMFVFFLKKDDDLPVSNKKQVFMGLVSDIVTTVTERYNNITGSNIERPKLENPMSPESRAFNDAVEIIVLFNNRPNGTLTSSKVQPMPFIQFFSVQQMTFNIMRHIEQPYYYLLDPNNLKDRSEIREMLNLNGVILKRDRTLASYNIKDGAKLIFV